MKPYYFLILLLIPHLSAAQPEIKVLSEPATAEDFEHQNKGCPENSECDPVMGHQMKTWKDMVKRLAESTLSSDKKIQEAEEFRQKSGMPAEFYTYKKSQQGFRPLYFNSPCKEHNPKIQENRVLRGSAFIKSMPKEKAVVWRDQTQIEVPVGELLIPQPVTVFTSTGTMNYLLPIDDQPLFIRDKALHIVREDEGFFYMLRIEQNGDWKIVDIDLAKLSQWEDKREYTTCPPDKEKKTPKEFGVTFCKWIQDEDSKKPVIVRMHAGCNA